MVIGTFETFFSARKSLLSWKVLLLIAIGTVMKEENFMAALAGVAERINRNEIDNLLEIELVDGRLQEMIAYMLAVRVVGGVRPNAELR